MAHDTSSQSTDGRANGTTARRALVFAILSTLAPAALPLALAVLRVWVRFLGAAADATAPIPRRPFDDGASVNAFDRAAHAMGDAMGRTAAEALYDAAPDGPTAAVFDLLSVVWFCALPSCVLPSRCRGLAAVALADLDAFDARDDARDDATAAAPARIVHITAAGAVRILRVTTEPAPSSAEGAGSALRDHAVILCDVARVVTDVTDATTWRETSGHDAGDECAAATALEVCSALAASADARAPRLRHIASELARWAAVRIDDNDPNRTVETTRFMLSLAAECLAARASTPATIGRFC